MNFDVGQTVKVQHRKHGRIFTSKIVAQDEKSVTVVDPRNGGLYTLPKERVKPAEGSHG